MTLNVFSGFNKRRNSTKQPTGTGTQYDVYLKDDCSVENPVFLIDGINLNANYCLWNDHYYFIDDIVLNNNNIYELHCTEDVLATYKTDIGSSTQFVERSASSYDVMVNDEALSSQQDIVAVDSADTAISGNDWAINTAGTYLLTTFGVDGVHVYAYEDLEDILGICSNGAYDMSDATLTNLVNTIGLNFVDVSAYVSNVRWVPFAYSQFTGSIEQVEVSFWKLKNYSAKAISDTSIEISGVIDKPSNQYTDFRSQSPRFSQYTLYLPGVGSVGLNALDVEAFTLTYSMCFDIFTGEVMYVLYTQLGLDRRILGTYSGKLACDIPWCAMRTDVWGLFSTLLGVGSMSGSGAGESYGAFASAVAGTTLSACQTLLNPTTSINSSVGNIAKIRKYPNITLSVANYGSKEFPQAEVGRPLYEHKQINTLSGFIKCGNPSLEMGGFASEKDQVNSYLSAGFYYE